MGDVDAQTRDRIEADRFCATLGIDLVTLEAVETGERLTATAEETHDGGRTAQYEVAVTNDDGDLIATFRGRVYRP